MSTVSGQGKDLAGFGLELQAYLATSSCSWAGLLGQPPRSSTLLRDGFWAQGSHWLVLHLARLGVKDLSSPRLPHLSSGSQFYSIVAYKATPASGDLPEDLTDLGKAWVPRIWAQITSSRGKSCSRQGQGTSKFRASSLLSSSSPQ